jgi:spoIIIJ-associated protein
VKDRAFTGRDVAEAVRTAALTLGLEEGELRYFVLDPGRAGVFGGESSPARIAVLMDAPSGPPRRPASPEPTPVSREASPPDEASPDGVPEEPGEDLETALSRVMVALGEAAGLAIEASVEDSRDAVTLRLHTSEAGFFLGADGEGAPFKALEHLLHRMFAPDVAPLKLRVEMDGYREAREASLRTMAESLAAEVRRDGAPRETPALNAYERRIVHMAAAAAGGVASKSEGEGAERRVVLHPAPEASPGGEVH